MRSASLLVLFAPLLSVATPLPEAQFGGGTSTSVRNDLQNNICRPYTFLFARGTNERSNLGSIVGPQVASSLASRLGAANLAVQGVNYPANNAGNFPGGSTEGPDNFAMFVRKAEACNPPTTLFVGGYSQGASVVHQGAAELNATQSAGIAAAVLFGDPLRGQAVRGVDAADVKSYCATGDPVCRNGNNLSAHLSYGSNASDAAAFLVSRVGR